MVSDEILLNVRMMQIMIGMILMVMSAYCSGENCDDDDNDHLDYDS